MSKTNAPGIMGTVRVSGTDYTAITLAKTGTGTARVRLLAEQPDDDGIAGTGGAGFTFSPTPVSLTDEVTANNEFSAVVPAAQYYDDETALAGFVASADNEDLLVIVRDASKTGVKLFTVVETAVPDTYALVPLTPNVPSTELEFNTPTEYEVPPVTDWVLGSSDFMNETIQTFRAPGGDVSSPFAGLWAYNDTDGILSSVPVGRIRIAFSIIFANLDAAKWEIWLQKDTGGGFLDERRILLLDFGSAFANQVDGWSHQMVVTDQVDAGDQFRFVIRHDQLADQTANVDYSLIIINAIASQS